VAFEDLRHIDDEVAGALAVFRIEIGGGGKRTARIAPCSLPASVPRFLRRGVCVESYPSGWRGASAIPPRQSSAENSRRSLDFIRGTDGECAAPRHAARAEPSYRVSAWRDGMAPRRRRRSALTSTAWPLSESVRRFAGARRGSSGLFPVVSYKASPTRSCSAVHCRSSSIQIRPITSGVGQSTATKRHDDWRCHTRHGCEHGRRLIRNPCLVRHQFPRPAAIGR